MSDRFDQLISEYGKRRIEGLRLYRPMSGKNGKKGQLEFHESTASEVLIRGGNRSGKTVSAMAEVASAATEIPIVGPDGECLPYKYRTDRVEPFVIWCIGKGQKNIGSPIHRLLFRPGAFKIIRDLETNEWRAWRPWEPEDAAREKETKPSPPLIPPRMIKPNGWAWEQRSNFIFESCFLTNNTEIHAFTSNAEPKQGDPVDLILIDEDIVYPHFVQEWQARLSDKRGRLIWSAYPHSANKALREMTTRAELEEKSDNPDIEEFVLWFSDNPYIDEDQKRKRLKAWSHDPNIIRARDRGEYIFDATLIYPNYSSSMHATPSEDPENDDAVDKIIRENNGVPPGNWTRYMVVDPGHTNPAALFIAIPPPELGDSVVLYAEYTPSKVDAYQFAQGLLPYFEGQHFEAFLIDSRAGRQTAMGWGMRTVDHYSEALQVYNIKSSRTGHNFIMASDNVQAGINAVRSLLSYRSDMTARLKVVRNRLEYFDKQIKLYKKKIVSENALEEPEPNQWCDVLDCLRYFAVFDPGYVDPKHAYEGSVAFQKFRRMKEREKREEEAFTGVQMGPGSFRPTSELSSITSLFEDHMED